MAVVEGRQVPIVPPDDALRGPLYRQAEEGAVALYARLAAIDPAVPKRSIRATCGGDPPEVCLTTAH